MSRSLTSTLKQQLFAQESTDPLLTLLTIYFPSETIRLVRNNEDIVSRGNTFSAIWFDINLPNDNGESHQQVTLTIDNVGLELIEHIRTITEPVGILLESVLASARDTVQLTIVDLKLSQITYNAFTISSILIYDDILSTGIPNETYGPLDYPGLF